MLYEINYSAYLFLLMMVAWVVGYPIILIYDRVKGNKFRPFYRLWWPFLVLGELLS